MISKKMISNLYILVLTMLIYILGHMNSTSIIILNLNMIKMQIIIEESMFHPTDKCTTSPGGNKLRLDG